MGISAASGPLYGAKQCLEGTAVNTVATNQTGLIVFACNVPANEQWFATYAEIWCSAQGNVAATVDIQNGTTSILTSVITCVTNTVVDSPITKTKSEDEGFLIASSSTLNFKVTTGITSSPANINISLHGYRRYAGKLID